jgi:DNA polymerase-1
MAEDKRLFLLDAFALIFRAYYGLGKNFLYNSKGVNVTAPQLFTDSLWTLLKKENPTHIAICFDTKAPTTRVIEHSFYKANRQETPEDLKASIPVIKEIIRALNIPIIEADGYEADDVIGTIAKQQEKNGYQVYMVTPDKDYGQLCTQNIFMYKPPFRGKKEEIMDDKAICEKWQIDHVDKLIDILGLMGDAVDNIPGIPGVGEKTAIKLVNEYGGVEGLLANTDKLKGKLKERVEENTESAIISKHLATIILDVPVEYNMDTLIMEKPNVEKLGEIFSEMEFRRLGVRILGSTYNVVDSASPAQQSLFGSPDDATPTVPQGSNIENVEHKYQLIDSADKRKKLIAAILKQKEVCFDTETTGVDPNNCELVGLSFSWKEHEGSYVPVSEDQDEVKAVLEEFRPFFESKTIVKIGQNIKYDMLVLKWVGIEVLEPVFDTMVAHYVAKPEMKHGMDMLSETYLGYKPVSITELIGKKGAKQGNMRDVPIEEVANYASEDADITFQLKNIMVPLLKEHDVVPLFENVESPLIKVLAGMEFEGINLDVDFLINYSSELGVVCDEKEQAVYEKVGKRFNLNSPKQLGEILFNEMELPYTGKKTKTGQFSTGEEILTPLSEEFEIISDILNYRELTKLKSTYVDALPNMVNAKTNRIHSSFRQTIVPTGRLSSDKPNLQNIPIRTPKGREVRKAFIPRNEDHLLLAADYSQIELRILAHMSQDPLMLEAFENDLDIHSATASKVFGVTLEEVTREMRGKAKAVNFGLAYGQTAFGLSQNLRIKRSEAKEIIDNYFEKYPGIRKCMDNNIAFAKEHGYSQTIMGRKRYLPDINSGNHTVRGFAERNAINSPIQGSAADMIKVAMINVHDELVKQELKTKMILQVHDELVFDVYKPELVLVKKIVEEKMVNAIPMEVPIKVEMGTGENWLQAH